MITCTCCKRWWDGDYAYCTLMGKSLSDKDIRFAKDGEECPYSRIRIVIDHAGDL